jgi:hypothetical protein
MKKQLIIIGILLVLIIVGLSGCFDNNGDSDSKNLDSRFGGKWKSQDSLDIIEFKSNGSE